MDQFFVNSKTKEELIDITTHVRKIVEQAAVTSGMCCIYTPHTTSGITINENADPAVKKDILMGLGKLNLENNSYQHLEGNSPAHIKSSLIGCSLMVLIEGNRLQLGTWQGIFFCEFDGPRSRKVWVQVIKGSSPS